MQRLCLIVHTAIETARLFEREFPRFGFRPSIARSASAGIDLLHQWRFDAVLIDADGSGGAPIAMIQKFRRRSSAPITVLASAPTEKAQLAWLQGGASDIVFLPASTQLIAIKLRRLLETHAAPDGGPLEISVGPLTMNTWQSTARVDGKPLVLTVHQFKLLYMLALRAGQFLHRDAIAAGLPSSTGSVGRAADVHIHRIRKKLAELQVTGLRLDTVHGRGYCLSIVDSRQVVECAERLS